MTSDEVSAKQELVAGKPVRDHVSVTALPTAADVRYQLDINVNSQLFYLTWVLYIKRLRKKTYF